MAGLRDLFDPGKLMLPVAFERCRPVTERLDVAGVCLVQARSSGAPGAHQVHVPQDAQVLGHRGLGQPKSLGDCAHRLLPLRQVAQDLPAPRLGDSVEDIRCGCCPWHSPNIYTYMGICQAKPLRTRSGNYRKGRDFGGRGWRKEKEASSEASEGTCCRTC